MIVGLCNENDFGEDLFFLTWFIGQIDYLCYFCKRNPIYSATGDSYDEQNSTKHPKRNYKTIQNRCSSQHYLHHNYILTHNISNLQTSKKISKWRYHRHRTLHWKKATSNHNRNTIYRTLLTNSSNSNLQIYRPIKNVIFSQS